MVTVALDVDGGAPAPYRAGLSVTVLRVLPKYLARERVPARERNDPKSQLAIPMKDERV